MRSLSHAHADLGLALSQIRALSVEASCDPRIVIREARALVGQGVAGTSMAAGRARAALISVGWPWPTPEVKAS
jgi:hypothetical protein